MDERRKGERRVACLRDKRDGTVYMKDAKVWIADRRRAERRKGE